MNWHWWILEKGGSAARSVTRLCAWILEDFRRRQLADFAVLALLAAGIGLVSIWAGAVILFVAVAMLVRRRCAPSQSVYRDGKARSDAWLEEDLDDYAAGNGAYTFLRDDD